MIIDQNFVVKKKVCFTYLYLYRYFYSNLIIFKIQDFDLPLSYVQISIFDYYTIMLICLL